MSGPAIKYYTLLVPTKDGLIALNEAGAKGHMLCQMTPRNDGTTKLIMAMPRSYDTDPWCPPHIQREIAKLDNAMRQFIEEYDAPLGDYGWVVEKAKVWSAWIEEIMNPKPEPKDPEESPNAA